MAFAEPRTLQALAEALGMAHDTNIKHITIKAECDDMPVAIIERLLTEEEMQAVCKIAQDAKEAGEIKVSERKGEARYTYRLRVDDNEVEYGFAEFNDLLAFVSDDPGKQADQPISTGPAHMTERQ